MKDGLNIVVEASRGYAVIAHHKANLGVIESDIDEDWDLIEGRFLIDGAWVHHFEDSDDEDFEFATLTSYPSHRVHCIEWADMGMRDKAELELERLNRAERERQGIA